MPGDAQGRACGGGLLVVVCVPDTCLAWSRPRASPRHIYFFVQCARCPFLGGAASAPLRFPGHAVGALSSCADPHVPAPPFWPFQNTGKQDDAGKTRRGARRQNAPHQAHRAWTRVCKWDKAT